MLKAIRTKFANAKKRAVQFLLKTWLYVPWGNICSFQNGSLTVTVTKQFLVVISDGSSTDALPIMYVSQELAYRIFIVMESKGYAVDLTEVPSEFIEAMKAPGAAVPITG